MIFIIFLAACAEPPIPTVMTRMVTLHSILLLSMVICKYISANINLYFVSLIYPSKSQLRPHEIHLSEYPFSYPIVMPFLYWSLGFLLHILILMYLFFWFLGVHIASPLIVCITERVLILWFCKRSGLV